MLYFVNVAECEVACRRAEGEEVAASCVNGDVVDKAWCEARAKLYLSKVVSLKEKVGLTPLLC